MNISIIETTLENESQLIQKAMTLSLAKHTLFCTGSNQRILFWMFDASLSNAVTIQLYITNDACQPQMDPHNCYLNI